MDNRDIGNLISGFAIRAFGATLAITVSVVVVRYVVHVFDAVSATLAAIPH